jgi:phage-related minor tail protein
MLATDSLGITEGKAQEYGQAMEALGDAAVFTAQQANDNFLLMKKGFQEAHSAAGSPLPTGGDDGSRKRYEKLQELHRKYLEEKGLANAREEDREFIRLNKWYDEQVKVLNDLHADKKYFAELWAAYSAKNDEADLQRAGKIATAQIAENDKARQRERDAYEKRLEAGERFFEESLNQEQRILEYRYKLSEAARDYGIDEEDVIRSRYTGEIEVLRMHQQVLFSKMEEARTEEELLGILDQVRLTMEKIKGLQDSMAYEVKLTQTMDYRYGKALSRGEDENAIKILNEGLANQKQLVEEAQAKVQAYLNLWNYAYATQKTYIADLYGVTVSAFQGMENAITDFVMTGKAKFTDFANSVIRDLMRIAVRALIVQPLAQGLLGMFSSGASTSSSINLSSGNYQIGGSYKFGGYGASGIDTKPGYAYVVGEKGPEVFLPATSGRVMPNAQSSVRIEVINQSGTPMEVKDSRATFDPQEMVVTLWMDAAARNRFGLRTLLQGA